MARRHEHFGLSYLEELIILKEREDICKKSRQEFLKFKQEAVATPVLVVEGAKELDQLVEPCSSRSSGGSTVLLHVPDFLPESRPSTQPRKIRVCSGSASESPTQDVSTPQMQSPRKEFASPYLWQTSQEEGSYGQEGDMENVTVAIASFVGTSKKITMLQKPECPLRSKYRKMVHARSRFKRPPVYPQKDQTEAAKVERKKSRIAVGARTSLVITETSDTVSAASTSSEKYAKMPEELMRPSLLSSVLEFDETYSRKSSDSSSLRSISEFVGESLGISRSDISKTHERSFPQGRLYSRTSAQKIPSTVHPRSIDEIIASLQSTSPTPSDLKIKELLESILGKDYSIAMEVPPLPPVETETKGEILTPIPKLPVVKVEAEPGELETPAEEVAEKEKEQTELVTVKEASGSTQTGSAFPEAQQEAPKEEGEEEEGTPKVEAPEGRVETPGKKKAHLETGLSEGVSGPPEDVPRSKAEPTRESVASPEQKERSTTVVLAKPEFPGILEVKGKRFPKAKPAEIRDRVEEPQEEQPLSLLSTWTSDIKDVDCPLIHHLCMAHPRGVLPIHLHLASRVHHTFDKKGHCILLPHAKMRYCDSELEEFFPVSAAVEEQILRESCSHARPSLAGACPERRLSLCLASAAGPGDCLLPPKQQLLKAADSPEKQSAAEAEGQRGTSSRVLYLASNWINGVIYEDFSCDLREEEESESEDDFDALLAVCIAAVCLQTSVKREREETSLQVSNGAACLLQADALRRSASAPELTLYREKARLNIEADFKTTMQEMTVMKDQAVAQVRGATPSEADGSPGRRQKSSKGSPKPSWGPAKRRLSAEEDAGERSPMADTPKKDMFVQRVQPPPKGAVDTSVLAEVSRQAGIKYIVFPKQTTSKKSKKAESVGDLPTFNKFRIKVSQAVRSYRSPSLPSALNFEKFAEKQGGIPDNVSGYTWTRTIWNTWFDEVYPPSRPPSEEKVSVEKKEKTVPQERELPLVEGNAEILPELQSEIDRISQQIEQNPSCAFSYCRRGAIYRKTGRLKAAMEDLEKNSLTYSRSKRLISKALQARSSTTGGDDAYLSRAAIYRKQGNHSLAIINYTLAMKLRPVDDEIYYRRGEIYEEEGDIVMAMSDYAKCFYYNPKRTDALMKHGIYFFDKSTWNVAISDFTSVIKEDPANAEARTFRGRAYLKQGKVANAAEDFAAAIHLNPLNWIAYYHRGCILRTMDPKQSLQDLSISVLLNDNFENLGAFLHRGILYAELRQWMLAICDFRSALMLDRLLTEAYVNIGLIYLLHLDRYFESIEEFTQAIRVNPLDTKPYICRAQAFQRPFTSAEMLYYRGHYLLEMRDYELASFCIRQVAQIGEGSFECSLVQAALVHSFCGNHNKAIECALEAARQQPDPPMYLLLGRLQMKAKKHKDAIASFKLALKILTGTAKNVPSTFEAAELHYYIGQCYMEQVCLLEAFDTFTTAVKLYPRYADAYYERGLCRMHLQQAAAILDFNKVLAISPKHFQAYLSRAAYYGSKGRFSKAIVNCTEALKIYPNSVRAFLYRGALKSRNRTYKHAIEDLSQAIEVDNVCVLAYYNRAISYHQMKDYKKALKDYGIVLLLEANKDIVLKVLINRGLLYAELNQDATALEDISEAAVGKPKDTSLAKVIGVCCHRLRKYEEAVAAFSKVIKLDPLCLDGYIGRGNAYMEYGHAEGTRRAQRDFVKAIHLNPMSLKARLCLGYNLQAVGKFQKAWNQFSAAIHIDPNYPLAYDGRAIVCLQMGDTFAAFQDTNTALKVNLGSIPAWS
ncbi:hypothetical protein lerEdw1_004879 [Lerista edwardsae]|nr:hypothetical protein lerEdw1_004879 [Lerista edwardsae]